MHDPLPEEHLRDLAFVERLGRLSETPEFPEATFCLRLDASIDDNLSARPPGLVELLLAAYDLMQPHLAFYGAESVYFETADGAFQRFGFPESFGRKPRKTDRETLARILEHAAEVEAGERDDQARAFDHLKAQGLSPDRAHFERARDGGSLVMADAWPLHLAENVILLEKNRSECWSLSVSFSPALWRAEAPAIMALVTRFALSGVCDSGSFGFALNSHDALQEVAERLFRPVTERFALINPIELGALCLTRHYEFDGRELDTRTHVPVGAWTFLSRALLDHAPEPIDLHAALDGTGAEVKMSEKAALVRLWPAPILGDVQRAVSLAPAQTLHRALAPLRLGKSDKWLYAIKVGYEADQTAWLYRLEDDRP